MSASPARQKRRQCQRRGHAFPVKTDGKGHYRIYRCARCGAMPTEDDATTALEAANA